MGLNRAFCRQPEKTMKRRTVAQIMHEDGVNLPQALAIQSKEREARYKGATDTQDALMMALDARISTVSDLVLYGVSYREADEFDPKLDERV